MEYRNIGRWGTKVSSVGLGSWLTYGGSVEEATRACVHAARARSWASSSSIRPTCTRAAGRRSRRPRDQGFRRDSNRARDQSVSFRWATVRTSAASRASTSDADQAQHSLSGLDVDYIDLYQCHRFDGTTPLEETCEAMNDLVRNGKIALLGRFGMERRSDRRRRQPVPRARLGGAGQQSAAVQRAVAARVERDVLPVCAKYGLGNVVWSPLAQGHSHRKVHVGASGCPKVRARRRTAAGMMADYFTQPVLDAVQRLKPIAERAGCTAGAARACVVFAAAGNFSRDRRRKQTLARR